jgi:hypothetical protein
VQLQSVAGERCSFGEWLNGGLRHTIHSAGGRSSNHVIVSLEFASTAEARKGL